MIRRYLIPAIAVAAVGYLLLMVTFEIVGVDFVGFMEDQPSLDHQEGPRRLPPEDSVPLSRPAVHDDPLLVVNPVPADEVSLQRGELLFGFHCAVCHGATGEGDGVVVEYWREDARPPADLTEPRIANYPDGTLYQIITQGLGGMPPLRENLSERDRWDVINYVRENARE